MLRYESDVLMTPPNGWSREDIEILEEELERVKENGQSLRPAFERTAIRTGRKANSIRNYYYTTYRASKGERAGRTFETFTKDEVLELLSYMLTAQAEGKSVRRAAMELGNFDHNVMLRYQNKYRSLIKSRPEMVYHVMAKLKEQNIPYFDPYAQTTAPLQDADEQQMDNVLAQTWKEVYQKLLKLPRQKALHLVQGIQALFDAAEPSQDLQKVVRENIRLQQENKGLVRQLEMIRMPIDGDVLADGGMATARHASQRYDLLQNTSQELAVFMPKKQE